MRTKVAKIQSAAPIGFEGRIIEVESDSSRGLPSLQIVGMGNKSIDEAKERVRSAINNSLLEFPSQRIIINLAPAELPKDGSHYDLPIALAILGCSGQIQPEDVENAAFAGELALDGTLRPIRGAINLAEVARDNGFATIFLPAQNAAQAAIIPGIRVIPVRSLKELFLHLKREQTIGPFTSAPEVAVNEPHASPVLDDILGQEQAKRALVIAAAGRHNVLLNGPPGAGKTMLAKTIASLLPPLDPDEQIAVTKLHSLAGETTDTIVTKRPFRAPHHTASRVSLVGGGPRPKPGDISLAHLGVLFLDETPEYPRSTLEAIRQPLEDRRITISRAGGHAIYPADFILVATMNPCPCGYYGDTIKECRCSPIQVQAYQKKLSGPFIDRIDLSLTVNRVSSSDLFNINSTSNKQHIEADTSIKKARAMQFNRYKSRLKNNGNLSASNLPEVMLMSQEAKTLLVTATEKLQLSARSSFKIIRVARTIADISESTQILPTHISEALQYRQFT